MGVSFVLGSGGTGWSGIVPWSLTGGWCPLGSAFWSVALVGVLSPWGGDHLLDMWLWGVLDFLVGDDGVLMQVGNDSDFLVLFHKCVLSNRNYYWSGGGVAGVFRSWSWWCTSPLLFLTVFCLFVCFLSRVTLFKLCWFLFFIFFHLMLMFQTLQGVQLFPVGGGICTFHLCCMLLSIIPAGHHDI